MGKFEQARQMMTKTSEAEKVKAATASKKFCVCGGCPSYNECAGKKKELLYCVLGKSLDCISVEAGCICPSCPVTEQMGLENEFFCTRGSEKEQRRI